MKRNFRNALGLVLVTLFFCAVLMGTGTAWGQTFTPLRVSEAWTTNETVGYHAETFYRFSVRTGSYYRVELESVGLEDLDLYGHYNDSVRQSRGTTNHGFACRMGPETEHFGFKSNYPGEYFLSVYGADAAASFQIRARRIVAPSVRTTNPASSGLLWTAGETRDIQWDVSGEWDDFSIKISRDAGASWNEYIERPRWAGGIGFSSSDRSLSWPVSGPAASRCRIRVQGVNYFYSAPGKYGASAVYKRPWNNPEDSFASFHDFEIRSNVTLDHIEIEGPDFVDGGLGVSYQCRAIYSDDSVIIPPSGVTWEKSSSYAEINESTGYLTTELVTRDRLCRIDAEYQGYEASKTIKIRNVTSPLTHIVVSGDAQVDENSTAPYLCQAYYADGNNRYVTSEVDWDVGGTTFADIDAFGQLTTHDVTGDEDIDVTATLGSESDSQQVTIKVDVPLRPPAPNLSYPPHNKAFYPKDGQQQFQWEPVSATPAVTGYEFYFEKVGGGYGDSQDNLSASTTSCPINFPPLDVRGKYAWKVRAKKSIFLSSITRGNWAHLILPI